MPEFFQTTMGHEFYGGTVPRIVKTLEKISANLEKLVEAQAKTPEPAASPSADTEPKVVGLGRILELSSEHITQKTAWLLDDMAETHESFRLPDTLGNDAYVAVYPRDEFGWFLSIPQEPLGEVPPIANDEDSVKAIASVVRYAQSKGCSWLLLDRDADKTEDLPTYDW